MRRRLLVSTLAVAVTAVLLLGLPLAFVLSRLEINAADRQVQRDATTVARTLQNRVNVGLPAAVPEAAAAARSLPDRYINVRQYGVSEFTVGDRPEAGTAIIRQAATKDFRVTVAADTSVAYGRLTEALALIGALALAAVAVAVALAILQARRLTRPLEELARPPTGSGSGTRARSAAGTGWPSSTGWPRAWTGRRGGSPTCWPPNANSPPTPPTSCGPR